MIRREITHMPGEWNRWPDSVGHNPTSVHGTILPPPGLYRCRLVKDGHWVALRIIVIEWRDEETGKLMADAQYLMHVGIAAPVDMWTTRWIGRDIERVSREDYDHYLALQAHASAREPDHPAAKPKEAIDLLNAPMLL